MPTDTHRHFLLTAAREISPDGRPCVRLFLQRADDIRVLDEEPVAPLVSVLLAHERQLGGTVRALLAEHVDQHLAEGWRELTAPEALRLAEAS